MSIVDDEDIDQTLVGLPHINEDDVWLEAYRYDGDAQDEPYKDVTISAPLRAVAVRTSGHVLVTDDRDPTRGRVLNPDGTWSHKIKTVDSWINEPPLMGYWEPCDHVLPNVPQESSK